MNATGPRVILRALALAVLLSAANACCSDPCPTCGGRGTVACPVCGGKGWLPGPVLHGLPSIYGCGRCGGYGGGGARGDYGSGQVECPTCHGKGDVESAEDKEARGLENAAKQALDDNRYADAERLYRQLIDLRPSSLAWNNLGYAIEKQGNASDRCEEIMNCYRNASRLDPNDRVPRDNLANWQRWVNRKRELEQQRTAEALRRRLLEEERQRIAEEQRRRRVELDNAWNKAQDAYGDKHYEDSVNAWREYIALNPTGSAYNNLGNALDALGRDTEALAAYQDAINRGSKQAPGGLQRTRTAMEHAQQQAAAVAKAEEKLQVPRQLADQGAYGQLLDVHYHSLRALLYDHEPMSDEARKGFDTEATHQRGRLPPDVPTPPAVAVNPTHEVVVRQARALEQQISDLKVDMLDNPNLTRQECRERVEKLADLRAKDVGIKFIQGVVEDPKVLPPEPKPKAPKKKLFIGYERDGG